MPKLWEHSCLLDRISLQRLSWRLDRFSVRQTIHDRARFGLSHTHEVHISAHLTIFVCTSGIESTVQARFGAVGQIEVFETGPCSCVRVPPSEEVFLRRRDERRMLGALTRNLRLSVLLNCHALEGENHLVLAHGEYVRPVTRKLLITLDGFLAPFEVFQQFICRAVALGHFKWCLVLPV